MNIIILSITGERGINSLYYHVHWRPLLGKCAASYVVMLVQKVTRPKLSEEGLDVEYDHLESISRMVGSQ
jgi:hypothetical protein